MRVHFWGTRGSIPSPLDARAIKAKLRAVLREARHRNVALRNDAAIDAFIASLPFTVGGTYGGNTSCVQLDAGHTEFTVCDAGSGLRVFGDDVLARSGPHVPHVYNLFLSHVHWDHLMGFPFFRPAYMPGNIVRIHGAHADLRAAFERQHGAPSFPVEFDQLGATIEFVTLQPGRVYQIGGFDVQVMQQRHPGDSYAYRFAVPNATVVYATDAEHSFRSRADEAPFVELFRDADVVIFDAMYSLGEAVTAKEDWGHSSNVVGVELAQRAHIKHLVLFHHDPASDDRALDRHLRDARRFEEITRDGAGLRISAAYDGLELVVPDIEDQDRVRM